MNDQMPEHAHFGCRIPTTSDQVTVNHGDTFIVSDLACQIVNGQTYGVVHRDTRFVSHYCFNLNGTPLVPLSTNQENYYSVEAHFTNPSLSVSLSAEDESEEAALPADRIAKAAGGEKPARAGTPGEGLAGKALPRDRMLAANRIHLRLARLVETGRILDRFRLTNHDDLPVALHLVVELRSDFVDLFAIRGYSEAPTGLVETTWNPSERVLVNRYRVGAFAAQLRCTIEGSDNQPVYTNGNIVFPVHLQPGQSWNASVTLDCMVAGETGVSSPVNSEGHGRATQAEPLYARWKDLAARCYTPYPGLARAFDAASDDMAALRLYEPGFSPDTWMPAAGIPWFMTVFGRDSAIASLQTLMLYPGLARGTLQKLAEYQGTSVDEWRLEEPGKILHEVRYGPLAVNRQVPHTPYYGSLDVTPLYVILLSEAWRWTGDLELLRRYLPVAESCISWIDTYGDHDGDGFLDYWRWVERGLKNQGWKDSGNSIVYPDGRNVPNPIALCEFQGYVYDAKQRLAELYEVIGQSVRSEELRREAEDLQRRFHESFWMEEPGFIALGLDGRKEKIRSIASNAGHCLWSGIVYPDRAGRVVARLLAEDMFSGWGIRTLSSDNPAFNPIDYQVGSVWPHDNALIAAGMKRYGFGKEANRVAKAIFDAAACFQSYRLPELYAGFARDAHSMPVAYPKANVPQAWAAGSVFMLLQTILGLRADAANRRLYVDPVLPDWLPDVTLSGLWLGPSRLDVRFTPGGAELLSVEGDVEVVQV